MSEEEKLHEYLMRFNQYERETLMLADTKVQEFISFFVTRVVPFLRGGSDDEATKMFRLLLDFRFAWNFWLDKKATEKKIHSDTFGLQKSKPYLSKTNLEEEKE